jgi:hypothetical protein
MQKRATTVQLEQLERELAVKDSELRATSAEVRQADAS